MKKIISLIVCIVLSISIVNSADTLTKDEKNKLDLAKGEIIKIYDKDINKAYSVFSNIEGLYTKYKGNEVDIIVLQFIETITLEYITSYEEEKKRQEEEKKLEDRQKEKEKKEQEEEKKKQEEEKKVLETMPNIDDTIKKYNDELDTLTKYTQTISEFGLEPRLEHLYLKNVYLANVGTVQDMSNIIAEVYLVNRDNKILSSGYVNGNYIIFDVVSNVILKEGVKNNLYVKAVLREATRQSETGELEFRLITPANAQIGTLNGIRVMGYYSGNYVSVDTSLITNSIVTLITGGAGTISSTKDFTPNYNEAMAFTVNNTSGKDEIELRSFTFNIVGSFINSLDPSTRFIVKNRNNNQIFGSNTYNAISGNQLTINYSGPAYNYISGGQKEDYILEIEYVGSVSGNREVRLENMVLGDSFGGTINNLNEYTNTGLPTGYVYYKY